MSRWTERFHEYISGLRVCRVTVPTPSPMNVISPSERPGGVRMPWGYGSDSVAFRVAPLSSDQGTAASVLKAAPVWPETVARESRKNLPAPARIAVLSLSAYAKPRRGPKLLRLISNGEGVLSSTNFSTPFRSYPATEMGDLALKSQ